MTLAFVGGTHRTVPLALRERLAFSAEQAAEALTRFRERFPGREGVLLSTCNRVEFYAACAEADRTVMCAAAALTAVSMQFAAVGC